MDLFFDPGRTNTLRERTTGILSDLLSEVIERVRGKTGEDMLSVAESLNVNRHNTLLHGIPLKEGVKDLHAAITEHAVSRKRKRTSGPSESDSSSQGSDEEQIRENGTVVDESSMDSSVMSEPVGKTSENEKQSAPLNPCKSISPWTDQSDTESKTYQNDLPVVEVQNKPDYKPPLPVSDNSQHLSPSVPLRTSSRRAKLDAKKEAEVAKPKPQPSPVPVTTDKPRTVKKPTENKPKKKRMSMKDLHKNCNKRYIKLADVMLTDVPLLLDGDSEGEDRELVTLIKSDCPENWSVGRPRASSFRRKYFCRKCTLGE